jgi:hypothetical protein
MRRKHPSGDHCSHAIERASWATPITEPLNATSVEAPGLSCALAGSATTAATRPVTRAYRRTQLVIDVATARRF